jgi:signal transduction histidine kinase
MLEGQHILSIDADALTRESLRTVLTRQGAEVTTASTGSDGLEQAASPGHFDLIVLDLELPDMGGVEVLRRIRAKDQETTVVILTDADNVRPAIDATYQGADAYVRKQDLSLGNDPAALIDHLERAMARRASLVAQRQVEQMQADLYAIVTHDLRNPTSCIQTSAEMLLNDDYGPLTREQTELIEIIANCAVKMNTLINDYLEFARIDAGFLELARETTDLRALVEASLTAMQPQLRAKAQSLTADLPSQPLWSTVDPERFQRVVDNLLANAVKYTPRAGEITVRLRQHEDEAELTVADTGIGIPPEHLSTLFTKYHRVQGEATRGIPGTGLGLLIAKEIVAAHGGVITAASDGAGRGSTFTVRLPHAAHYHAGNAS